MRPNDPAFATASHPGRLRDMSAHPRTSFEPGDDDPSLTRDVFLAQAWQHVADASHRLEFLQDRLRELGLPSTEANLS